MSNHTCKNCGNNIEEGYLFCIYCGSRVEEVDELQVSNSNMSSQQNNINYQMNQGMNNQYQMNQGMNNQYQMNQGMNNQYQMNQGMNNQYHNIENTGDFFKRLHLYKPLSLITSVIFMFSLITSNFMIEHYLYYKGIDDYSHGVKLSEIANDGDKTFSSTLMFVIIILMIICITDAFVDIRFGNIHYIMPIAGILGMISSIVIVRAIKTCVEYYPIYTSSFGSRLCIAACFVMMITNVCSFNPRYK